MDKKLKKHYKQAFSEPGTMTETFGTCSQFVSNTNFLTKFTSEIKKLLIEKGVTSTTDFDLEHLLESWHLEVRRLMVQ